MFYKMIAACPDETKGLLAEELKELGASMIRTDYRAVWFEIDEAGFYRVHLCLRTASRLMLVVRECAAKTGFMLFNQACRIDWSRYITPGQTFLVEGIQADRGPGFMKSNDLSKRVREALQSHFSVRNLPVPEVNLKEPDVRVIVHSRKGRATISFDTSGLGLHRRGYQSEGHPAPIKETLAASLLMLIGYDGSKTFLDPMCGSGTIAIEAAYIALRKAPLTYRKNEDFGFSRLQIFNRTQWKRVNEQVRAESIQQPLAPILARDNYGPYLKMAIDRSSRARVGRFIDFEQADFFERKSPSEQGILVANLPYGERIENEISEEDMIAYFKKIGDHLKRNFKGWRAGLLVPKNSPYKFIGLKPRRKIDLKNGNIPVKFLIFELY